MTLSIEMVMAIAAVLMGCISVLGGCVAVLWRQQVQEKRRCEAEVARMGKKLDALDGFQRGDLAAHAKTTAGLLATAMPLLERALRVLRRMEGDLPPDPDATPLVPHPTSPAG